MKTTTFRKLVMQGDMNAAGTLFGGSMMSFLDEAAALYVMCQLKTKNVVTLKVAEVIFKVPVFLGDFLVFDAETISVGKESSIKIKITVSKKDLETDINEVVTTCEMIFVSIDPVTKKPCKHILAKKNDELKNVTGTISEN
jgi:acyl-CoA hydrolase